MKHLKLFENNSKDDHFTIIEVYNYIYDTEFGVTVYKNDTKILDTIIRDGDDMEPIEILLRNIDPQVDIQKYQICDDDTLAKIFLGEDSSIIELPNSLQEFISLIEANKMNLL